MFTFPWSTKDFVTFLDLRIQIPLGMNALWGTQHNSQWRLKLTEGSSTYNLAVKYWPLYHETWKQGKDTWLSLVVPSTDIDVCILYSDFANWSVFIPKNRYLQAIFILLLPNFLSFKARLVLRIRSTSLIRPGSYPLRSIWALCVHWNARSARRKLFPAIKRETNNVFYWGFVSGQRASELAMIFV